MPCDVFDKARCFLGNGQYDSGLAGGGEIQAGEVEARQDTHAIRVNGLSRSVERISKSHIAEIALEACTPHHARNAGSGKIERTDEGIRSTPCDRLRGVGIRYGCVYPGLAYVIIDITFDIVGGLVPKADICFEIVGERKTAAIRSAGQPPEKHNTLGAERLKAYRVLRPEHTARGYAPRKPNDLLSPYVEKSAFLKPDHDIASTIAPWEPPDATGRKEDGPPRLRQFLRNLSA